MYVSWSTLDTCCLLKTSAVGKPPRNFVCCRYNNQASERASLNLSLPKDEPFSLSLSRPPPPDPSGRFWTEDGGLSEKSFAAHGHRRRWMWRGLCVCSVMRLDCKFVSARNPTCCEGYGPAARERSCCGCGSGLFCVGGGNGGTAVLIVRCLGEKVRKLKNYEFLYIARLNTVPHVSSMTWRAAAVGH